MLRTPGTKFLPAVEAPKQGDRLRLGDGPSLPTVDAECVVQAGNRDFVHLHEEAHKIDAQLYGIPDQEPCGEQMSREGSPVILVHLPRRFQHSPIEREPKTLWRNAEVWVTLTHATPPMGLLCGRRGMSLAAPPPSYAIHNFTETSSVLKHLYFINRCGARRPATTDAAKVYAEIGLEPPQFTGPSLHKGVDNEVGDLAGAHHDPGPDALRRGVVGSVMIWKKVQKLVNSVAHEAEPGRSSQPPGWTDGCCDSNARGARTGAVGLGGVVDDPRRSVASLISTSSRLPS